MKKAYKILTNVLLGALTLSSLGLANVQAEEVSTDATNATNASIEIVDGPIDHTLPSDDIVFPEQTFSFATYFGSEDYSTAAESGSLTLKVNDQRSLNGITNGWKVTAQLSTFTSDVIDGETLPDTTYISLTKVLPQPTNNYVKIAKELAKVTPKVNENIKLYAGMDSAAIWSANRVDESGNYLSPVGVDDWTLEFLPKDISLTIPHDKLVGGSHSAKITWTFAETSID